MATSGTQQQDNLFGDVSNNLGRKPVTLIFLDYQPVGIRHVQQLYFTRESNGKTVLHI